MEVAIFPTETGIQLSTTVDICEADVEKFHERSEAINGMELDLNLTVRTTDDNEKLLFTRNITAGVFDKEIDQFKNLVKEFMTTFHKLQTGKVEKKENPEAPTEKEIEFVKNLVEPDMVTIVGAIFCEDGYCDIRISPKVFTLMCNSFIEKYGG